MSREETPAALQGLVKLHIFHKEPGLSGALTLRCGLGQVASPFPEGYLVPLTCMLVPESEMAFGEADSSLCLLQLGRPPYVSEWADVVRREGQVQQEAGSSLYVEEARVGDAGIYTCRATNLQGTGTATTHVHVTRSP